MVSSWHSGERRRRSPRRCAPRCSPPRSWKCRSDQSAELVRCTGHCRPATLPAPPRPERAAQLEVGALAGRRTPPRTPGPRPASSSSGATCGSGAQSAQSTAAAGDGLSGGSRTTSPARANRARPCGSEECRSSSDRALHGPARRLVGSLRGELPGHRLGRQLAARGECPPCAVRCRRTRRPKARCVRTVGGERRDPWFLPDAARGSAQVLRGRVPGPYGRTRGAGRHDDRSRPRPAGRPAAHERAGDHPPHAPRHAAATARTTRCAPTTSAWRSSRASTCAAIRAAPWPRAAHAKGPGSGGAGSRRLPRPPAPGPRRDTTGTRPTRPVFVGGRLQASFRATSLALTRPPGRRRPGRSRRTPSDRPACGW